MRRMLMTIAVCAFSLAAAELPFTGTWRVDLNKLQAPKKPSEYELGNGVFRCLTCDPKVEVKADGQDQPVAGHPAFDTMNVRIVDDKVVESTAKKGGKLVGKRKVTVSADLNHAVAESTGYPPNSAEPVSSKVELKRVGAPKPGMHASSGAWVMDKMDNLSENARDIVYEQTPDGLSAKDSTGFSYSAKFDGKDYPVLGDRSADSIVLKRIDDRTIEGTFKYQGKIRVTTQETVSMDGKTLTLQWRDSAGFSGTVIAVKK